MPKTKITRRSLDPDGLAPDERIAVERFLIHGNRARAWREAGKGCGTSKADRRSYTLKAKAFFSKPKVALILEREYKLRRELYRPQVDWVLEQLGFMVKFSVHNIYGADGRLLQPSELDEATASCITQIEFHEPVWNEKRQEFAPAQVKKYHFTSKTEAVLMAMKHLKLLGEGAAPTSHTPPVLSVQFVTVNQPQLTAGTTIEAQA